MFSSAKYRNFEYGADDHIAVVHTEDLNEQVAIFVTTTIHKSSHNGQFNYGRNFYTKDADSLNIMLPVTFDKNPDYEFMGNLISFKAYDCGKDMISAPLLDTEPINVSIDEELIEIKLIHEDAVLHCSHSGDEYQWLHTRAIVFMFQTKSLSIWKDMSWSEIINVSVSDKNWQLPPNEEWENSEDEIYDVTSSIEILN